MRGEGVQGPPSSPAYTFGGGVPEMFSPHPYAKGNVDTAPRRWPGLEVPTLPFSSVQREGGKDDEMGKYSEVLQKKRKGWGSL